MQIIGAAAYGNENGIVYVIVIMLSFGVVVCQVVEGVTSGRFMLMNTGIIGAAAIIGYLVYRLIDVDFLATGIMLLVFGLVLFTVNFLLSRKMKNTVGEAVENEKQK
jgi:hypothetical protein